VKRKRMAFVGLLFAPAIVLGQFMPGLPTLVYDPSQAAHVITEIAQIVKLYETATQTYNQIAYSATWFTNKNAWRGIATQIVNSNTPSLFGETGGWNPAVTAGLNIPSAWQLATFGIHPPAFYAGFPVGGSSLSANIASVNVADGISQAGMAAVANSRLNQPLNDLALTNLEQTSQDTSDGTNSEIEQLNLLTNGTVLANRQQENTNALLTSIAEQQILTNKTTRDTIADSLNVMSVRDTYIAGEATQWGGSVATIAGYRQ
jgi:type IV secretion system protein TrbJ